MKVGLGNARRLKAVVALLCGALMCGAALPIAQAAPQRGGPPGWATHLPSRGRNPHPHLDGSLNDDLAAQRAVPSLMAPKGSSSGSATVTVVVESADAALARHAVEDNGGTVVTEVPGLVKADVPASELGQVSEAKGITYVREPYRAEPQTTSEGVVETGASAWHTAAQQGAGTKVAIVDIGFQNYSARLGTELPASVETDFSRCTSPFAQVHGTAVSEIVNDMAPAATLRLVCIEDDVDFAAALASLNAAGVDIANGSIGFTLTGRGDGSGAASTPEGAVAALRNQGVLYVASAGNYGGRHYHTTAWGDPNPGYDFTDLVDLTSDDRLVFAVTGNGVAAVSVKWDGWPTTTQDFDLYVGNDLCGLSGYSEENQRDLNLAPVEAVAFQNCSSSPQLFEVIVNRFSGGGTPRIDVYFDGAVTGIEQSTPSDLAEPATSPAALAVGAHCWSSGATEAYSSTGPTIDGRIKPDISGPDATSSSEYGAANDCFAGFGGTSAAAPHVAGAAAVLLGANPALDVAELEQLLKSHALDAGSAGPDNSYGAGKLRLGAAGDVALATPQPMTSVVPVRLFDSRPGTLGASEAPFGASGRTTPLPGFGSLRVAVTGIAGVPANATAVVLNVTVTEPTTGGWLTVHPGTTAPNASNLNFTPGQTVAQHVTATVGTDGKVQLFNGAAGTTHVIIDLAGWYGPTGVAAAVATDRFTPLNAPARAMDTRPGPLGYAESVFGAGGRTTPIPLNGSLDVAVAGGGGVPSNATAVMLNVTVTSPTDGGFLLVHPTGAAQPLASSLNFNGGQTLANLVVVPVGTSGNVRLSISGGPTHAVVDVVGYYLPNVGAGYVALDPPTRDLDTRSGNGPSPGALGSNLTFKLKVARYYGVPADAAAVMLSVVAADPTAIGWLTVFPGTASLPPTSTLNFTPGSIVPNAAVSKLGTDGTVGFYNSGGSTSVISDLAGFFIDPALVGA